MITENVVDRNLLADAIVARLRAEVQDAEGYVGEAGDVPAKTGSDSRPVPYWVLHPGAGGPASDADLGDQAIDNTSTLQVTCCGDSEYDVLALATKVDAALYRWRPVVAGMVFGRLKPPPGYDAGTVQRDNTVKPHRPYLPLQYQTTGTVT